MNEDQPIAAAEREMDIYRNEVARVTAERDQARDALARALGWFSSRPQSAMQDASVTRAQLANAYKDGGLPMPNELRRYL